VGNRFNTTTKLIVGSLLLLSPAYAAAAGLGKLSVLSALGQPLKAEIDIVAMQPGEGESLTARIASPDAFRQAGVEYGAVVPQLRAIIEHRPDGRAVLALKSQQPVNEPFVDVLVELDSASGRLVRQYTFLLDPIGYKGPEPAVVAPTTATAQSKPAAAPAAVVDASRSATVPAAAPQSVSQPEPDAAKSVRSAVPTPSATAADAGTATYRVKQGDTLAAIAEAHRSRDVSLQRMLVALHRANADAFINNNMNLVRAGAILRVPDAIDVDAVEQDEAVRVVNTQAREFNDYRASLAAAVAAAPAATQSDQQRASGRITAMVDDKPAVDAPTKDELRLSRSTDGKGVAAAAASASDDAAASGKALQEANDRVADLERNLKDLQKLLDLKNAQLAALQQQAQAPAPAAEQTAPAATDSSKAAAEATAAADKAAALETAPAGEAGNATSAADSAPATAPAAAPAASAESAPAADAAVKAAAKKPAKKKAAPPPPPEPSFIDSLLDDPVLLAGGGGALIALLAGLFVWQRKRRTALDNSLVGMTTTDSSSVFGTTGGRSVDTGASALQTDFSQGGIGSIDTEEVDPVAEADVYMAYGRDAQAEEILKEALQKDPSRQAVRLKLLEIYAARKDLQAFEVTATEIKAATGGQGADWEKTVALGRSIDPNNAMYGAALAAGAAAAAAAVAAKIAGDSVGVAEPAAASPLLDLDLDLNRADAATTPDIALDTNVSQALDLDLDLDLGSAPAVPPAAEEPADFSPSGTLIMDAATKQAASELGSTGNAIDFDLDAPTVEQKGKETAVPALDFDFNLNDEPKSVPAVDLSRLSLDLDSGADAAGDSNWQEVATKLDLAKAYEEMGDKDGARELLNEVLKEGDSSQQAQARTMLEAIR
jgi:pilus assembly protein FimV